MSCNYNQVTLAGRLTKDPEYKVLNDNVTKLSFILAVNRGYKKEDGQDEADFIPICMWGKIADAGSKLLKKGAPTLIWGKLKVRSYEVENERKWATEVRAENFQLLAQKNHGVTSLTKDIQENASTWDELTTDETQQVKEASAA